MSKIDDVIAERKRIEALAAAAPKLPKRMLTYSTLNIAVEDDGGVCVSNSSGQRLCFLARKAVPELVAFLNEWYADPAPAQPDTGWRCAGTPPMQGEVVLLWWPGVPRGAYLGLWNGTMYRGYDQTFACPKAPVYWHPLPAPPKPSAVA